MQNLQDEMMDLMDVSSEIQETLGRSYSVPDDIDEEDLMGGKLKIIQRLNTVFLDKIEVLICHSAKMFEKQVL